MAPKRAGIADTLSTTPTATNVPHISYRVERRFPIRIQEPSRSALPDPNSSPPFSPAPLAAASTASTDPLLQQSSSARPEPSTYEYVPLAITESSVSQLGNHFVTNRFNAFSRDPQDPRTPQRAYSCDDEPIHIPGAVQKFGALVAAREADDGCFQVRIVSENSQSVTGLDPVALFELRSFTDILSPRDKKEFLTRARALRACSKTIPDVFQLSLNFLRGPPQSLYCAMHYNERSSLIICEFELQQDVSNLVTIHSDGLPDKAADTLDTQVSDADRLRSVTSKSEPLYSLAIARAASRQLGSMDLFHTLSEIQTQMASATALPELLDIIVGMVHELTGFHRVMVYQFDETGAGSVVSEIVDPKATRDVYRGLHFPASDIPKQARELYVVNKIRLLYDREQETARLVCHTLDDAATPLDLKHSYLRAMSPIHMKYLENMGVRSSMSITLMVDNAFWGLITCHSYGTAMRVSLPLRELCRSLGQAASVNIEKIIYSTRINARKLLSNAPIKKSPTAFIAASSSDLLTMFGADFGFLAIKGEARTIGRLIAYSESIALLQYIRRKSFTQTFSSQSIKKDCSDIDYAPGFLVIAGILVIPLTLTGTDFLVFFRQGKDKEILWAGNPYEKSLSTASYLEPRSSFKRWSENVVGTSRQWTDDEVESATVLSTLYGRFIQVWRQKEAIVQKNRVTRLLIRNAGHDVRTPLNSIINCLEIALEQALDEASRNNLQNSLQASRSLVFVVNELLSLTEVEDKADLPQIHEDNVDLTSVILDVISAFKDESRRRNLEVSYHEHSTTLEAVRCDPVALRQVLSNLLENAIKHSSDGIIRVTLDNLTTTEVTSLIEIAVEDDGEGLSEVELDGIFQEFEQILDDDENQEPDPEEQKTEPGSKRVLIGLGLAIAARYVRLNQGQISISSEVGNGTRVSIKIPFQKPFPKGLENITLTNEVSPLIPPPGPVLLQIANQPTNLSFPAIPVAPIFERLVVHDASADRQQVSNFISEDHAVPEQNLGQSPSGTIISTPSPLQISPANANIASINSHYSFPKADTKKPILNVLIAEDNPLNSRILETRLLRRGHKVKVTVNGKVCAETFEKSPESFDVILMDIQMPITDGIASTNLIRAFEKEFAPVYSEKVRSYGRIPIIAVSASLLEQSLDEYINCGFDGWMFKPIDFKRLEAMLAAVEDEKIRDGLLYSKEIWGKGGWFSVDTQCFSP